MFTYNYKITIFFKCHYNFRDRLTGMNNDPNIFIPKDGLFTSHLRCAHLMDV